MGLPPPVESEAEEERRRRWKEEMAKKRTEALWRSFMYFMGVILILAILYYVLFGSSTPYAPPVVRVQTPMVYQSPVRASVTQSPAAQTPVPVVVTQSPPVQTPVPVVVTQSPPVQTQSPAAQSPVTGPWKKCFQ